MEKFQHYFIDTVKNRYVDFKGRSTRSEFWYFMLFYVIIGLILVVFDSLLFSSGSTDAGGSWTGGLLSTLLSLGLLLPSLGLSIRRLHDIGKTGWWVLISLVPLIGFIVLLIFYVKDSQPGSNEYGSNPKGM
jgi:uncharacterized membrane protein YhaH (DUF805 family)